MTIIRPNIGLTYSLQYVFQGSNRMLLLSIQSGVRLIEIFNNKNSPNTIYFSVRVRLIEVSAEQGFVIKGNIRR